MAKNIHQKLLHVTNNTINIEQHNLGVIKQPSKSLFAFTSVEIGFEMQEILPNAHFLFTSLAKLTLIMEGEPIGETIECTVYIFEKVSSLNSKLFVELKIGEYSEWRLAREGRETGEKYMTLGDTIGTACERLDAIYMTSIKKEPINDLFTSIDEKTGQFTDKLVCWPRLVELNIFGHEIDTLENPVLFEKLVPNLRKLNLDNNPIKSLDVDLLKHAKKLHELDLDLSNIKSCTITNETFHGLVNLRVLNINSILFDSFEPFNCLFNLEELTLVMERQSPFKRLEAFPHQLSKLRMLKLNFGCEIEWIEPTAFDHLIFLERLELECLGWNSNNGPQVLQIGKAPRHLKIVQVERLRLLGSEKLLAGIENIELFQLNAHRSGRWRDIQLKKLECDWPLSGLKRMSATLLNEKSLSFNQMRNLEFLCLNFSDFLALSKCRLGCLSKLKELKIDFNFTGMCFLFIYLRLLLFASENEFKLK
jgi:Leucine-rich repeat (LRR) protein